MKTNPHRYCIQSVSSRLRGICACALHLLAFASVLILASSPAEAAPPDLTNGGVPNNQRYSNLGPTGLLGWVYYENYGDSGQSRQIMVQAVDSGSPAAGKLALGDVILGADGTGANPVNFTADARRGFSNAINDAEARTPAELKVLRWRAGTTTTQTLTLRTMGAYSATAPYNCPKSALILEEGLQAMMSGESAGYGSFGTLALLAGNNPANPNNAARRLRAQNEARALIPSAAEIAKMTSGDANGLFSGRDPWSDGHQLIVLTEYYLLTNDALVLPAIDALSKCIGYGQNTFGSYSHRYATKWRDGSPNGPMRNGYGTVNNTSMLGWLGLLLTRECGVSYPDLNPAIARASRFFGYYSGKGTVPYGEHDAAWGGHENNGKSGLAAVCFELESTRTAEQKFFAKMATAATSARDEGHTGPYFNYVWSPIGAAAGGEAAATAHFNGIRWMLDLNRRWNGSFVFDSLSPESANNGGSYSGFSKSTPPLLLYALPLRQLHITGRGHDSQRWLSTNDVAEATAVDHYTATTRSTSQLVADLGSWSPRVQRSAAEELGKRPGETTALLPALHALATDPQGTSRAGACFALGQIGHPASAGILASLLTDPANLVRYAATAGLTKMPQTVRQPHLNTVLAAAASNAAPLFPLNEEDPAHLTHAQLGPLLFDSNGMVPTDFSGVNKSFLFPAIRAIASNPVGRCRSTVGRIYNALNQTDYLALADTVVNSAYELTPADKMFAYGDRLAAQRLLERFNAAEGVPLSVLAIKDDMFGSITPDALGTLQLYAGGSKTVVPDTGVEAALNFLIQSGTNVAEAQAVLAAIAGNPNAAALPPLKSIQSVIPDAPTLTLPANLTVLRTTSNDFAKGDSIYTWRRIRGAGNVIFSPNATGAAKDTAVIFDGIPGQYLFEVKMSDSKNLTEVFSTVAVTLNNTGGTLPPNTQPVANSQSPSVPQATATPITLTGSDPEGYPLNYRVTSQPTSGKLTGSAPLLIYTSNPSYVGPDSFTFEAIDSEGLVSSATVSITVTANSNFPTAIYEPFNYPAGALNGDTGTSEVGFTGVWAAATGSNVVAGSLAYGSLPTLGGSIGNLSGSNYGGRRLLSTTALTANGLLNDGSTLWFSVVMGYGTAANLTNDRLAFALANSNFDTGTSQYNIVNESPQLGSGLGVTLGSFGGNGDQTQGKFVTTHFRDSSSGSGSSGNIFGTVPRTMIGVSQQRLIVGKFTWGAASDKLEIFEPDVNLNLGPVTSTLTVNVNQSTFDTLTWRRNGAVTTDEIRFGPSFSTVLNGNAPMTADTSAPAPATMAFHEIPTAVSPSSIRMVAVSAYDTNQVEYYFSCTAGGGQDSGWQDSPSYTNTGLTPGVLYSYRVKARDKSPARNETALSSIASATISTQTTVPNIVSMQRAAAESIITTVGMTVGSVTLNNSTGSPAGTVLGQTPVGNQTLPLGSAIALVVSGGDFLPPTPNPATFAVAPAATNSSTITMTATAGSDPSGVQYLFTETSGNPGGTNSAWQDSPVFSDNGLNPSTQYTYTVSLRDKSPNANQTAASASASATTNPVPAASIWYWDGGSSDIPTNGNGASAGGTGTWNNTLLNWDVGSVAYTSWNNAAGKTAVFGGTAGTVTIGGGGVTAGNVQFTTADYLINGDPLTVSGPGPIQISLPTTIQSALAGNVGLTKSGTGTLTLSGANAYTGGSIINAGTLIFRTLASKPSVGTHAFGVGTTIGLGVGFGEFTAADVDNAFSGTMTGNLSNVTLNAATTIGIDTTSATMPYSTNIGAVSRGLTKLGTNTLTLSGTNSAYTGVTTVASGTLEVGTLANAGTNSSIGNFATAGATGLTLAGGTFNYTGASTTTNRGFTASGAATKFISVAAGVNLTLGASVKNEVTGLTFTAGGAGSSITISSLTIAAGSNQDFNISTNTPTVTIQNLNVTGFNVIAQRTGTALLNVGNINGSGSSGWLANLNVTGVISGYTGQLVLGNDVTLTGLSTSDFNEVLLQQGGVYTINTIKNVGAGASSLGNPSTAARGLIHFGNGGGNPILKYTGTGGADGTTNRTLYLKGSGNTLNLEQAGTGHLLFTAPTTAENAAVGNRTLNLTGSTAGTGEISGAIVQSVNNPTALRKSGSGKWTLSGANTYTGTTTINAGTLLIDGNGSAAIGVSTVAAGATLGGKGTLGGNLTVASGGKLTFDLSTAAASHDKLQVNGSVNFAGASELTITSLSGASPGVYTLVTGASITGTAPATLNLPEGWIASLSIVGSDLRLDVTSPNNRAPAWTSNPVVGANATEDSIYSGTLAANASDIDTWATLTYAKVSGPAWLSVAANGTLSGTPSNSDVGANSFSVSVSDGIAPPVTATLNITVINTNDAPVWSGNPVANETATEDNLFSGTLATYASDADPGATLTFAKVGGPAWLNVAADGTVSGIPSNGDVGPNSFTARVSDGIAPPVETALNIMVINTNDAPVWAGNPLSGANATEDAAYSGSIAGNASDVDAGATLTFAKVSGPAWLAVGTNGALSGTPDNSNVGVNSFTVSVSDGIAAAVNATLNITVINTNDAPVWTINPMAGSDATEVAAYSGTLAGGATDVDAGASLTFAKVSGPAWLSVAANGTLSGTPANSDVGANSFIVSVSDGTATAVEATLDITVLNTNDAPVWTTNPVIGADATEDNAYIDTLAGEASDADAGAIMTFVKVSGPAWLAIASDGSLTGAPANGDVGTNSFTVSVSDGIAPAVETTFNITVINTNDAPTWAGNPITGTNATEDTAFSENIAANAGDIDTGAVLAYAKVSGPSWLSVTSDGTLSGTPSNGNVGANSFIVSVSDGIAAPVETTFNISVTNTNDAPSWAGNPITGANANEDAPYSVSLAPSASDPDAGATLTFAKVSGPAWLSVAADGTLSGTPANSNVGANSFSVSVSDGIAPPVETTLNITVINTNDAPVFTIDPIIAAGATENVAYTGQTLAGSATDTDAGDTITYSKVSGPAWLIVALDGALSGTPGSGTAGLNTFVVRATDSTSATTDATLQITVTGLPLPWISADIGTGMLAGSASYNAGTFTQAGSGIIGSTSDKLRFTYQTLTGDGEIIAKISSLQNTGTSSRVGVMIRDSLATNSKQIFMGMTGTNAYRWVRRTATGGSTTSSNSSTGTVPNTWVRLVRSGTTITAYKSSNGTSWTSVGSTTGTTFASTCYIGLAVGSGGITTLNTSQFSNVSVTP